MAASGLKQQHSNEEEDPSLPGSQQCRQNPGRRHCERQLPCFSPLRRMSVSSQVENADFYLSVCLFNVCFSLSHFFSFSQKSTNKNYQL